MDVHLFQYHLLRDYIWSIVMPLLLCQRSVAYIDGHLHRCVCLFLQYYCALIIIALL